MTAKVAKRTIGRVTRSSAAGLLSKTGKELRKEGVVSGFQVNTEPNWVTAVYKISERPRSVEVRISPKLESGMFGILVATLVDNYGDFVAGITGPKSVGGDFSPEDLKTELVDSLLRHSIADIPGTVDMKGGMKNSWGGVFMAALDAREKAEVVYDMIRREKNRLSFRVRGLNKKRAVPVVTAS